MELNKLMLHIPDFIKTYSFMLFISLLVRRLTGHNINPLIIRDMFSEAVDTLRAHSEYLNQINVFPVPDGDTGINMLMTMQKVNDTLNQEASHTLKSLTAAIEKGAFDGAKGNSGIILSQFFMGVCRVLAPLENLSLSSFKEAMSEGAEYAKDAVLNPREGTMISVMRDTAYAGKESSSWHEYFQVTFEKAQESIRSSPEFLPELKKAGVYDSGAIGFLYIYQAWINSLSRALESSDTWLHDEQLDNSKIELDGSEFADQIRYRFCTEGRIMVDAIDEKAIRSLLETIGDSLLLISSHQNGLSEFKIHLHTNTPSALYNTLCKFGSVLSIKIDDMKVQTITTH